MTSSEHLPIKSPSTDEHRADQPSSNCTPSPRCSVSRKMALVGGRGVGKSAITQYCIYGEQSKLKEPNPSVEYCHHICFMLSRYPKATFNCSVVDTPGCYGRGRNIKRELSRNVCIGVDVYILVFSITSRESFEQIIEINRVLFDVLGDPPSIPRVLVGNMADRSVERTVSREAGEALAREWGVQYVETSGITGQDVQEVFNQAFKEIEADNPLKMPKKLLGKQTEDDCFSWYERCTIS